MKSNGWSAAEKLETPSGAMISFVSRLPAGGGPLNIFIIVMLGRSTMLVYIEADPGCLVLRSTRPQRQSYAR